MERPSEKRAHGSESEKLPPPNSTHTAGGMGGRPSWGSLAWGQGWGWTGGFGKLLEPTARQGTLKMVSPLLGSWVR